MVNFGFIPKEEVSFSINADVKMMSHALVKIQPRPRVS